MGSERWTEVDRYITDLLVDPVPATSDGLPPHEVSPPQGMLLELLRPRKVTDISVTRGASARGVKAGDRIRDVRDAYPRARVDRSTEDTFGITLVRIPKRGGGRIQFSVPVDTGEIDLIAVPLIAFCE